MKPNKKDIMKWIEALRSGKYKQGRYALQSRRGYCCLGVACKIFINKSDLTVTGNGYLIGWLPRSQKNAPQWLRWADENFLSIANIELSNLNDGEKLSFDEIADCLQAVYIEEVL